MRLIELIELIDKLTFLPLLFLTLGGVLSLKPIREKYGNGIVGNFIAMIFPIVMIITSFLSLKESNKWLIDNMPEAYSWITTGIISLISRTTEPVPNLAEQAQPNISTSPAPPPIPGTPRAQHPKRATSGKNCTTTSIGETYCD